MSTPLLHELFVSPIATVHIINHNRNTTAPNLSYFDQATNQRIFGTEEITGPNQVTITLFVPRALIVSVQ